MSILNSIKRFWQRLQAKPLSGLNPEQYEKFVEYMVSDLGRNSANKITPELKTKT
jgi:hypothetical protein